MHEGGRNTEHAEFKQETESRKNRGAEESRAALGLRESAGVLRLERWGQGVYDFHLA